MRNQILMTVTPNGDAGSVTLICEPERAAWTDWFLVDYGTNLENAEALGRAITRRVAERRRSEQATARQTATEKELTVAKLSLLHAQVEPHFLYNTLASAQLLTRSDPAARRRDAGQPDHLPAPLAAAHRGCAVDGRRGTRAGARLPRHPQDPHGRRGCNCRSTCPSALRAVPFPTMMLQTLVENAIKHGLEPQPGGGTVWILARSLDSSAVAVTVADDGRGFSAEGGGTGIGLRNVRERLRLAYGAAAGFTIVANFPTGVAATITCPAPRRVERAMAKCVIAEDETLLRDALVQLLAAAWPELEVAAACEDGGAALEAIAAHQPDVAFLDIRMPGLTGLEVAAALAECSPRTQVVFVTAYDQYAIDAFERGAVDYLLKPVAPERLAPRCSG